MMPSLDPIKGKPQYLDPKLLDNAFDKNSLIAAELGKSLITLVHMCLWMRPMHFDKAAMTVRMSRQIGATNPHIDDWLTFLYRWATSLNFLEK